MATLTRPKFTSRSQTSPLLSGGVPTPFPREQLQELVVQEPEIENPFAAPEDVVLQSTHTIIDECKSEDETGGCLTDVMPSITTLQKSCIMTLNNLLSGRERWNPIVPDRRHSMPSTPGTSVDADSSSSALQILVINLRNCDDNGEMLEVRPSTDDSDLLFELKERIEKLSPTLEPRDAVIAHSLVTLLSYFNRLSIIQADHPQDILRSSDHATSRFSDSPPPIDMFDALTRQLSDLQMERLSSQIGSSMTSTSSTVKVETAILWSQIDKELENVVAMCKERTEGLPRFYQDHLPPRYDYDDDYDVESPPDYEPRGRASLDEKPSKSAQMPAASTHWLTDEKMRLDLEGVAMAIDRLYLVAPQLHNQRVELKSSKLAQLEKARREGITPGVTRKGKERDVQELEDILDLLGRASERTLKDQSVVLEGGLQNRLEKARVKDMAKRDAFVDQLVKHSGAGRIHGQDAVRQPRIKDPQAMLTLPEFIREQPPHELEVLKDPQAMLSLPEFVAESPPPHIAEFDNDPSVPKSGKAKKKSRHRSLSAPPLAWLRSASSRSNSSQSSQNGSSKTKGTEPAFDVVYVAENHENLQHVLVFFTVTGSIPGVDLTAKVLPPFPEHISEGGDHLVIQCGPHSSLPLMLPARTTPGKKEVKAQSGHFEIKLTTLPLPASSGEEGASTPLLDATQLTYASPASFICSSCSLPLVQPSTVKTYRDLPSEHWEELVEAWMCHTDQKLHEQVLKHGKGGFWPQAGQAFVGGSYILFEESSIAKHNLHLAQDPRPDESWRLARCLCGAIVGRCREKPSPEDSKVTVFRLLKYAIRPVSTSSDPLKFPLSAFIVEDMSEYVEAHASYRFVIRDEEEERPRILIWLFKPRIRLAYTTPKSRALPKSASVTAAKVLYKLIKPHEAAIDLRSLLNKYPGFPQAEQLSYPMAICRRLAGLLKESNTAYPEGLRTMTGLEIGWLHRT